MGYIIYSISFFLLVSVTVLYLNRHHWSPYLPTTLSTLHLPFPSFSHLYTRLPNPGSWTTDVEAGLHSATFDLTSNITEGDSRSGLDETQKREVLKIMKKRRVNFDEARRLWMEGRFAREGIGADGLPRDPKFVSFS
ncbi:hypothetical protein K402DRAFT_413000 [Aulographum hederae CBS 113979]|uniref:Uncharacterized protein n=1 Tax=Aulographum hederae CBS 113979 TaxID=1176131 RepID=A0A6G1GZ56_9PEZI|nr:hypothetical protein K402DRAFT_413000 [Aulographum hederae CBS 113979]